MSLRPSSHGYICDRSDGGLVRALAPVLDRYGGSWIGWTGVASEDLDLDTQAAHIAEASADTRYRIEPIALSRDEVASFYQDVCNRVIWPVLHDQLAQTGIRCASFAAYADINRRFAERVAETSAPDGLVLVQDYPLMLLARELRALEERPPLLTFFLHTPFPAFDLFATLPFAQELLDGLLAYDLVGLQTERDRRNLLECVERMLPHARVTRSMSSDSTSVSARISFGLHTTNVRSFPIGIDFEGYARGATSPAVEARVEELRKALPGQDIVLGIDRLDYTKGIPHRLDAIERVLSQNPQLAGRITFVQVLVPSREDIDEHRQLKALIDQRAGEINARFSSPGCVPVQIHYRRIPQDELLALYRSARVLLVTPLKDGMNLVAKELCAARIDEDGVLILSRFAGAAEQLGEHALLVNPYDSEQVATTLVDALELPRTVRRARMRALRAIVERENAMQWMQDFLEASTACSRRLSHLRSQRS